MTTRTEPHETLTIAVEPDLVDRIKVAANARQVSVDNYVEGAIQQALESETPSEDVWPRRLTDEQRERGLRAAAELDRLRHELFVKNGRKLFPPSWELINEMRDERTRELMRAVEE